MDQEGGREAGSTVGGHRIAVHAITGSKEEVGRKDGAGKGVDLSGVAPERRETIRRRVAALEAYEALPVRTVAEAERLCAELKLATPTFYRLLRSWRTLRDPAALEGARTTRRRRNVIDDAEYVRSIIAASDPHGSHERTTMKIEEQAARDGVRVRSRSALRRLVRDIREAASPRALASLPEGVVALDMVPIELPVMLDGRPLLPVAATIVHPASGAVLSVLLSMESPSPSIAAAVLIRWVESLRDASEATKVDAIMCPTSPQEGWTDLRNALGSVGVGLFGPTAERVPAGSIAIGAIGRSLLGFDIRPGMTHRPPETRRPKPRSYRRADPPSLEEAQAALDDRVAAAPRPSLAITEPALLAERLRLMSRAA